MTKTLYREGDRVRCTVDDTYRNHTCFRGDVATVNETTEVDDTTSDFSDVIELKLPDGLVFYAYCSHWEKIEREETAAEDKTLAYLKRTVKDMIENEGEALCSSCVVPLTDMLREVYAVDTGVHQAVTFTAAK